MVITLPLSYTLSLQNTLHWHKQPDFLFSDQLLEGHGLPMQPSPVSPCWFCNFLQQCQEELCILGKHSTTEPYSSVCILFILSVLFLSTKYKFNNINTKRKKISVCSTIVKYGDGYLNPSTQGRQILEFVDSQSYIVKLCLKIV